jgi:hypothetical protein
MAKRDKPSGAIVTSTRNSPAKLRGSNTNWSGDIAVNSACDLTANANCYRGTQPSPPRAASARWLRILLLPFLGACVFASCAAPASLSAISSYASTTAASATSFATLAADYGASCERYRSAVLGLIEPSSAAQQSPVVVGVAPGEDAFLLPDASPAPGYTYTASTAAGDAASSPVLISGDSNCNDALEVSRAWDQANVTVLNYVQALGNLANVDAIPTANPAPLATGLTKAGVAAPTVQAASTLITTISAFFVSNVQERDISAFLQSVNPYMARSIEALEITDASYTLELDNEFRKTTSQYAVFVRAEVQARDALKATDVSGRDAFNRRLARTKGAEEAALSSINQRLQASHAYGAAVGAILATHQDLYKKSLTKASLADYVKIVETTGAPIFTNLQTLAKAVK